MSTLETIACFVLDQILLKTSPCSYTASNCGPRGEFDLAWYVLVHMLQALAYFESALA